MNAVGFVVFEGDDLDHEADDKEVEKSTLTIPGSFERVADRPECFLAFGVSIDVFALSELLLEIKAQVNGKTVEPISQEAFENKGYPMLLAAYHEPLSPGDVVRVSLRCLAAKESLTN